MRKILLAGFAAVSLMGVGIVHAATDKNGQTIIHRPHLSINTCQITWITAIEARFGENDHTINDGRHTALADGIQFNTEGAESGEKKERLYDNVIVCLRKRPTDCPAYYYRGGKGGHSLAPFYTYFVLDLTNGEHWTETGSEHECTGA